MKFTDEAVVRSALSRGRLTLESHGGADLTPALAILEPYLATGGVNRLFSLPIERLERDRARREAVSGMRLADLAGYYQVAVTDPAEAEELINRLNQLAVVEIALAEPLPEYAGWMDVATPDYSGSQDHLRPAPDGVDADYAGTILGGDGSGVKVIDVEGGWLTSHEDLSANPPFVTIGGQIGALDWRNHGTAVMGEIMGVDNGFGMTGIAPGVQWGYSSIAAQTTANALLNAGAALDPGDVILIELHAPGPHYDFESREDQKGYVCMEYWQPNFDVIQQLFFDGIVVCEAAGNGSENFDDPGYYGSLFDTTFRNSHAIICGAGAPPGGQYGADRARLGFSNYGERVNLQGYGAGVYTTGYGNLFDGGSEASWYTST
ncbi:MAG TPA: S8 family serine peptidase, partial [candidate division Zixibacteria bacterium]|nr:S8 family serine peptidase [candidate division Zixibacteria bacterium]